MRFTKIKYDGKKIVLHFLLPDDDEAASLTYENADVPSPDFQSAMQDLSGAFCDLLELPGTYAERLEIRGVTLKWAEHLLDERPTSVLISAVRQTDENGAAALNTPNCEAFSVQTGDLIWTLHEEARSYLMGKRATLDLFNSTLRENVERMRPKRGSGIDSIEITHEGRGVRLTPDSTEAIGA